MRKIKLREQAFWTVPFCGFSWKGGKDERTQACGDYIRRKRQMGKE